MTMLRRTMPLYLLILVLYGCMINAEEIMDEAEQITETNTELDTELIFQTGFGLGTEVTNQNSSTAEIVGIDYNLQDLNRWDKDLEGNSDIGYFNIQYQGGNQSQRLAEIVPGPVDPDNSVLQFWIKEPNLGGGAGRIQANIYENGSIYEMDYSIRLFLPEEMIHLKNSNLRIYWLTLMEFWNNANWAGEDNQYRMTMNLIKARKAGDPLKVSIKSQKRKPDGSGWLHPPVWEYVNTSFEMPIGKWMRIDVHFKEGDDETGRFVFSVQPDGEPLTVVHDINNFTHHPDDKSPDGLRHFNPFKLYTAKEVIDEMRKSGNTLNVYWDDFKIAIGDSQEIQKEKGF